MNHHAGSATGIDLAALEKLARAATPGEWKVERLNGGGGHHNVGIRVRGPLVSGYAAALNTRWPNDAQTAEQEANAEYIAAANPATVLELIALARATPQHPDLIRLIEDLLHNSTAVWSGNAELDKDFERRYDAAAAPLLAIVEARRATPQHSVTDQASDLNTDSLTRWGAGMIAVGWQDDKELYIKESDLRAALAIPASTAASEQHPDDAAVDRFAAAMKGKMAASRAKGRGGWDDPAACSTARLQVMLAEHLAKGDPVDVGNFAMMLWNRGERTADVGPSFRNDGREPDWNAYAASEQQTSVSDAKCDTCMGYGIVGMNQGQTCKACNGTGRATIPSEADERAGAVPKDWQMMGAAWDAYQNHPFDHAEDNDDETRKCVEAAVRAALTHRATTAPGSKLVPIEPTDDMCRAAREKIGVGANYADHIYRAMLAATPDTATTAADQQGDTASASCEAVRDKSVLRGIAPSLDELYEPAQQGAAQAQAGRTLAPDGWVAVALICGEPTSVAFRDEDAARAVCIEGAPFPFVRVSTKEGA